MCTIERLEWSKLLSTERARHSSKTSSNEASSLSARNEFEKDYDRIVGSSSVRRLQDKAQVFPLQENDVARTRLTHSIEVSALARSLGKTIGKALEDKKEFTREQTDELSALLQVAGLIHDLGNPPFGHYGETVIQDWFKSWFNSSSFIKDSNPILTEQEKEDFLSFDGNVQNLRIVSKLQTLNDDHGANFTFGTLATIMKYPWPSNKKNNGNKKFGYFKSEEGLACKVRSSCGLADNVKHPATYLLEAADDIIYLCDDIEDGVKKGCIDWDKEYEQLKKHLLDKESDKYSELFQNIDVKSPDPTMDPREKTYARVRNFRNCVQSFLFKQTVKEFLLKYDSLMSNELVCHYELLDCQKELTSELKDITARNCFSCREVLALELTGHHVLSGLLDIFVPIIANSTTEKLYNPKYYPGKLFSLISPNFVYIAKKSSDDKNGPSVYDRLHLVTDFISGMTDSYAVNLYQELTGIKHP